ncbi:MAG: fimbrial biogenesis outer membrane usher protein [Myxococcales bacterium]|nr:fimbrial biogenesis outer membrane usher protein [Myxococcales bacterium]
MHRHALILVVLCAVTSRARAQPVSDEEAFAQVFKSSAPRARAPVMLLVAGVRFGIIILDVTRDGSPKMPAAAVLDALATAGVRRQVRDRISDATRGSRLSLEELRASGLDATYDTARLELRIAVAAEQTELTSHPLGPGAPPEAADALRPNATSGYVNVFGHAGVGSAGYARLDSAINVHRWLLEVRGDVGQAPIGGHRGDVLLSRDVPERALRYVAGDFAIATAGLQPGFPILGVGVTRNYTLQPYRVLQPVGSFEFSLERPSDVTVLVNGLPIQTLALLPGRHDVRDLPLGAGVTDVELLIRDDAGVERRLSFSAVSPNELLAPGIVQFSLGLGFPLVSDLGLRDYAWSRPIASGRRRWGVSDRLTLGSSADGDLERQVLGASVAVATHHGNLSADVGASHDLEAGMGIAESVRFDRASPLPGGGADTFTIAARHFSSQFRSLESLAIDGRFLGDVSIATTRQLVAGVSSVINLRYQIGRKGSDAYDSSLAMSRTFGALAVDALVGLHAGADEAHDIRVFVGMRWRAQDRSLLQGQSRTSTKHGTRNELRFTTARRPQPGGLNMSTAVSEDPTSAAAEVSLAYATNRFTTSGTGAIGMDRVTDTGTTTGSIDLGTAIAFVGGRTVWTRPINGSFAIIAPREELAGQELSINATGDVAAASANGFGPAVITSFDPYRVGVVRVAAPNLPIGMSLGPSRYSVLPGYKTGQLLEVGEPGTVFVRGVIVHPNGEPVGREVGELVPTRRPAAHRNEADNRLQSRLDEISEDATLGSAPALVVMTNRAGRFSVIGVVPGHYELRFAWGAPIVVDVPAGVTGVYTIGLRTLDAALAP